MPSLSTAVTVLAGALVAAALAILPAGALAADPVASQPSLQWDGAAAGEQSGSAVAEVGDVNGDGLSDTAIGSMLADPAGRSDAGSVYVAFGRRGTDPRANDLPGPGIRIDGPVAFERVGFAVAAAGDVNGDGRADVLLTTREADYNGRSNSGSAYVVFGRPGPATIDLAALGAGGFRIDGVARNDRFGASGAGVGDVNGDGLADVAVGANGADHNGRSGSGSVYVIFGKGDSAVVGTAALGARGYRIDGAVAGDALGPVARLGDLTGDGRPELLVGAPAANPLGRSDAGSAYVVAGKADIEPLDLSAPASYLSRIDGAAAFDNAGAGVAAAGDPDADGRPELLVGAIGADPAGRSAAGSVYVLDADAGGSVDLASGPGWRVNGPGGGDVVGSRLAGGRDVNGDGVDDLVVGNPRDDRNGRSSSGSAYVLYGGRRPAVTDLAGSIAGGFRIDGPGWGDLAGSGVALAHDTGGDGRADVVMGAPRADRGGRADAGTTWLVYGFTPAELSYPRVIEAVVTLPLAPVEPDAVSRTGSASFQVSPPLPAGLTLDPATGTVYGTPTYLGDDSEHVITMTDLSGTVQARFTLRVAPAPGRCANGQWGTEAADRITGSRGGDLVYTNAGDDLIDGGAGDDCLNGQTDADTINGGDGDDEVTGEQGADVLRGDAGMDDLDGGAERDEIHGGAGGDLLLGEDGSDELAGDDGDDRVHGGEHDDKLWGGAGADGLFGSVGSDRLSGEAGADLLRGEAGADTLDGGADADSILGQEDRDVLRGGGGVDALDGGTESDNLDGGAGRDVLTGGGAGDRISDSSGSTRVDAGAGRDVIYVRNRRRDTVRCGPGRDVVVADRIDRLSVDCERRKRG